MGNCQYEGRPLAPPWNHCLPSLSCVTPQADPFAPVDSFSTPCGVQRARNALYVLYIQLSIDHVRNASWCSTLPVRPYPVSNSSFLSATPSPLVSVNFHTSSAFDSFVRMTLGPNGVTNRGKLRRSTKTVCLS